MRKYTKRSFCSVLLWTTTRVHGVDKCVVYSRRAHDIETTTTTVNTILCFGFGIAFRFGVARQMHCTIWLLEAKPLALYILFYIDRTTHIHTHTRTHSHRFTRIQTFKHTSHTVRYALRINCRTASFTGFNFRDLPVSACADRKYILSIFFLYLNVMILFITNELQKLLLYEN